MICFSHIVMIATVAVWVQGDSKVLKGVFKQFSACSIEHCVQQSAKPEVPIHSAQHCLLICASFPNCSGVIFDTKDMKLPCTLIFHSQTICCTNTTAGDLVQYVQQVSDNIRW